MKRKLITYSFLAALILNNLVFLHAGKSYADVTDGPEVVPVSMDKFIDTSTDGHTEYYPNDGENWVGSDPTFGDSKSALQFDLSNYTGTFSKALLKIYITNIQSFDSSSAASVNVWGSNQDNWKEDADEFPTQDTQINEDHADNISIVGDYVYLDVTSFVNQKMLDNKKVSLVLTGQPNSNSTFSFASDDNPYKAVLELTPNPQSDDNTPVVDDALNAFNQATTVDEMQAEMEENPLYAFDTEQGSQSFFSDVKNDKRYVYQYMLDHRPEGGFTNQEDVQDICGEGIEERSPYMNLHESRDPMMIDFSLMMPDDFDFGIDLSYLASFIKHDEETGDDYSEVDAILAKLTDMIPEDGFIGPDDLQAAINECIQEYVTNSVKTDKEALEVTYADGDDANHVTQNLGLPTSGDNGTEISWESSDPQYVSADGTVTPPSHSEGNKEVTLTAKIKRDSQSSTKTFTIQVLALPQSGYTVSFDTGEGSTVPSVDVEADETISMPDAPTREGYMFEGWYTDNTLTTEFDFSQGIHSYTTIYAKWKKQSYTVTFDTNGGSDVSNQNVNDDEEAAMPEQPTKEGYTFEGWYTDNTYATEFDFSQGIHSNTTIYAKWEKQSYTVTFNTDGGSEVSNQNVNDDEKAALPEEPTKEGYTFEGWYTDNTFVTEFDFSQGIHSNTTIYAKWEKQSYTVSFDTDGGSPVSDQKIDYGNKVTQPAPPEKEGYEFVGWDIDNNLFTPFDFNQPIKSDVALKAIWIKQKYVVQFYSFGNDINQNQTIEYDGKVNKPVDPVHEGHTFVDWYTDPTFLIRYDFNLPVRSNMALFARWQIRSYTVHFDTNGGSAVEDETVSYQDKAASPENPAKEGYTFKGWYKDSALTTPWNFTTDEVTKETTLYAKWEKQSYTVHFDTNGGSAVEDETVSYQDKAASPENPVKEGYTFKGWYKDSDLTTPWNFKNDEVTRETTLYVKWEKQSYTVHFDTNGGSAVEDKTVSYQDKAASPEDPSKAGYTFAGWFTDNTLQNAYDFDHEITKDTTLYAKWLSNDATLASLSLSGDAVVSPAFDPTKELYTANVGNNVDSITVAPTTANDHATITVNGQISSANIHLNVGQNEVTIVVTAQDGTTKTYTITVNRAAPPVPNNPPSDGSTRQVDVTVGHDSNGIAATVDITRRIENGVKVDEVYFNESKAQEVVQKAIAQNKDISTIILTDLPQDVADEMKVNVLQKALGQLGDHRIALQIETPSVTVSLPKETVQSLNTQGNDLYFRVAPIRKEVEQQKVIQETLSSNAVKQAVEGNTNDIQIYGNPITIETNYNDFKTDVLFPLKNINLPSDPTARNAFLNTLRVYVKHTDGTEEFLKGDVVKDASRNPVGIKIQISKFSTFTVLGVPQTQLNHAPVVSHVAISGSKTVGSVLKGTYTYSDADSDSQGKTVFRWYRADNSKGLHKQVIKGAVHSTYTLTKSDTGKYIGFEVVPVATKGNKTCKSVDSAFIGKIVAKNAAPTVSGVKITGDATVGKTLHVSYKYHDVDGDKQGKTIFKWYRVVNNNKQLIKGATKLTYKVTSQDESKRIVVEVTPVAKSGVKTGAKKTSSASKVIKAQYNGYLVLGVIRSKSYVERIGSIIHSQYYGQVTIKKSGSYYKLSANFKTKAEATKAGRDLKRRKFIINYSTH